jgi:AraC-like DNA-binding protein/quercetin dioxygenase-like cupin family protein
MKPANTRKIRSAAVFHDHDLPIAVMRMANHGSTPLHSHDFHELVLITGGGGSHITAHGAYSLKAGDVFLIRGSTTHGYAETDRLVLVNVLFNPKRARLPLNELDLGAVPGYHALFKIEPQMRQAGRDGLRLGLNAAQLERASAIIEELGEELQAQRPGCRFMACGNLMRLIGFLSRCYSALQEPRTEPVLGISRALSYIEQHYGEPLTIGQLVREARMSESTFMRRFREAVGRTPVDYLIHTRVTRACELLRQNDGQKLAVIAEACGFEDANYFSRQFHRIMGCTPRAYRSATPALH